LAPRARFSPWPGALLPLHTEAEDTIAVATLPQPTIARALRRTSPATPALRLLAGGVQIRLLDGPVRYTPAPKEFGPPFAIGVTEDTELSHDLGSELDI
jgi:hypothetical protein